MPALEYSTRAEWFAHRKGRLGASEVGALFGVHPHLSHWSLWQIHAGRVPAPSLDDDDRVFWGRALEDAIAGGIADREGWEIRRAPYYVHDRIDGFGASPDFELRDGSALLEIKNVAEDSHRRIWAGEPPAHILLQVQAQLSCSGFPEARVGALIGGCRYEVHPIAARPRVIAQIEKRVRAFWQSIRDNRPPPVDGSASTSDTLAALYPKASLPMLDLRTDNMLPEACAGLLRAKEDKAAAEREIARCDAIIREKAGPAEAVMVNGFTVRLPAVAGTPDQTITADMVGQTIKGRAGHRRLSVKRFGEGEAA